ncbi:MAG: hypothetical protein MJZ46_05745, partial [Bacteroidales bacterium]|nr:hypothetical protein [Bacteroidales bacterium]
HQIEETTHSEDKQLGYFFAKPKAGENFLSTDTFVNKVIFYLWNDVFKDEDSAVFQYDNDKVEDVSINRSGTMYFRHFMANTDEMIHYFINQLFVMGKDNNPVVPIDYLKYDNDPKVIEHLPKMREEDEIPSEVEMSRGFNNQEQQKDYSKYRINGIQEDVNKKNLPTVIIKKQIESDPNISIDQLKEKWGDVQARSKPIILDENGYDDLINRSPSYKNRFNKIEINQNIIWVNNQIDVVDVQKIIEKAKHLGINVDIVEK